MTRYILCKEVMGRVRALREVWMAVCRLIYLVGICGEVPSWHSRTR
jgi:hypothetical protein